jgi:hypothetical protein
MSKDSIIFIFLVCVTCWSYAQDKKSTIYVEAIRGVSKNKYLLQYGTYLATDTVVAKSGVLTRCQVMRDQLRPLLMEMVEDKYFPRFQELSLSSSTRNCGYYIESDAKFYLQYSAFQRKREALIREVNKLIKSSPDLLEIKAYSGEREFIFLKEMFYYDDTFQPYTIDDLRLKTNITSLCVLCPDVEMGKPVTNENVHQVGFSESDNFLSISLPIIDNHIYMLDVSFHFIKY